jgi:hypothetical protein
MTETLTENVARLHVEHKLGALRWFKENGTGRIFGDPTVVYEFLLEHGRAFNGVPWKVHKGKGYRRGKVGNCYENAWRHAIRNRDLTYHEGFAYAGIIPTEHAWCVDSDGVVVDPTWRERDELPETEWSYFGIPLGLSVLAGADTYDRLYNLPYRDEEAMREVLASATEEHPIFG